MHTRRLQGKIGMNEKVLAQDEGEDKGDRICLDAGITSIVTVIAALSAARAKDALSFGHELRTQGCVT